MKLLLARKEGIGGPFPVTEERAKTLNPKGFGIFYTVNSFHTTRITGDLEQLLAWHCDLDTGTKEDQRERIKLCPVLPSIITETKRGYQCQWLGKDFSKPVDDKYPIYKEIEDSIVRTLKADPNAKDVCRLHRAVGYYHMKDPANPFLVIEVHNSGAVYSESWMLNAFGRAKKKVYKKFDGVVEDCKTGLMKLSGSAALNGDIITFRKNSSGTEQIIVNGQSTACWIDRQGMIGSHAGGGPTLKHWVMYYNYTWREALDILRKELGDGFYSEEVSDNGRCVSTSQGYAGSNRSQESSKVLLSLP